MANFKKRGRKKEGKRKEKVVPKESAKRKGGKEANS